MLVLIRGILYLIIIMLLVIHANGITGHYGLVPGITICLAVSGITMFLLHFWTPKYSVSIIMVIFTT